MPSRSGLRRCWARKRRCSCPAAHKATGGHPQPLRPGRRVHRRPGRALLSLRSRRCGGAGQRAAAAAGPPGRRQPGAGRNRSGDQARRRALCAQPPAGAGKHPGRQGAAARLPGRSHGFGAAPRLGHAPGRRAAVQCGCGDGRGRQGNRQGRRRAFRHGVGVLQQGPGSAGRLRAGWPEAADRSVRTAGARCSVAACARRVCWQPRRCMR